MPWLVFKLGIEIPQMTTLPILFMIKMISGIIFKDLMPNYLAELDINLKELG